MARAKAKPKKAKTKTPAKTKAKTKAKTATVKAKPKTKPKAKTKAKARPAVRKPPSKPAKRVSKPAAKQRAPTPAAEAAPGAASALIDEAMAAAEAGDFERAATSMLEAAALVPEDWRLPNEAGIYYYQLERYDDALRCYEQALALVPDNVPLRMNRALVFILTDRDDEARTALHEVLELDPLHAPAYFELGKLEQKYGQLEDALTYFNTALVHETMGTMFEMTGAPPRNMRLVFLAMLNKARSYFGLGREDEGVEQVRGLWEKFQDPTAVMNLAGEIEQQGHTGAAERVRALVAS